MIDSREIRAKELETNIGRLVHVSQILPEINHFLNGYRSLLNRAKHQRKAKVPLHVVADCHILLKFLEKAHEGISMNLLAYRLPDRVYRSDSCPAGLGGYSDQGFAWHYYLPPDLLFRASNNLLEHIASIITVWIDVLAGRLHKDDCILSMTDSSTSEGWARKSNFDTDPFNQDPTFDPQEPKARAAVCRKFAEICLDNDLRHFSQWFPGKENDVSDALSRDDDRTDAQLTSLLYSHVPSQMPSHFEIVPLPSKILSWLTALLQSLTVKKQLRERHKRTKIGRSRDGPSTQNLSDSGATSSSMGSQGHNESSSWERLPWLCERGNFRDQLMRSWLKQQSEVPFHMWHRPSGRMTGQTPQETTTETLDDFYLGYTELLERKIQRKNNKRHYQQASC